MGSSIPFRSPGNLPMVITGRGTGLAALGLIWVGLAQATAWGFAGYLGFWATLVFADLLLAASPGRLEVERSASPATRLGEPSSTELLVRNSGRIFRGIVRDAWQPSAGADQDRHPVQLPRGERRAVVTDLRATRRGDLKSDRLTIRSLGPLGLAGRQASRSVPGTLRVLPPFTSRKHLPSRLARLREIDGRAAVNVRGQGIEFDSLREYVPGDDVRSIDWRATARRQQVVTRTWRPERDRRVLLVLDTSRTAAGRVGDAPRLDAAIDAALLLAALTAKAGDRVDLLAIDRRTRAQVAGSGSAKLLADLVNVLAPLEATLVEADWPQAVATITQRLSRRSLVVLLTTLDSAALEEGLLPVLGLLTRRHQVVLASVCDPQLAELAENRDTAEDAFTAAAAERTILERDRLARIISRAGAEVVDAAPHDLPPQLADCYLALKAAGRL